MAQLNLPLVLGPITISRRGAAELAIRWSDGHEGVFPFLLLRERCPCAMCGSKPTHPAPAASSLPVMPPLVEGASGPADILSLGPIGRYAVSFSFGDGHSSGIYSYDYLRRICPCQACAAARDAR
jgi:DUF971 family protein